MTANSHADGSSRVTVATARLLLFKSVQRSVSVVAKFGGKALAKAHIALKALQLARMLSTLSNMSDRQLAEIGISRSEIPEYAEKLMADT